MSLFNFANSTGLFAAVYTAGAMAYKKQLIPVISAAEGYEKVAATYDQDLAEYDSYDLRPFVHALPRDAHGLRVLDAGGGTGRWAIRLAKRGADVTLADPAPAMLAIARRKDGRITTVKAAIEALPFPDASFDVTLCAFVLGYCPDLVQALGELVRVTRPGGLLLLSSSSERKSPLHRVENRKPFLIDVTYHRPDEYRDALEDLGCTVEVQEPVRTAKDVVAGHVIIARH